MSFRLSARRQGDRMTAEAGVALKHPIKMPKYMAFAVYYLPIRKNQTQKKCSEMYQLPYVESVSPVSYCAAAELEELGCAKYVRVVVNMKRTVPNTHCRVEQLLMEILEN